MRIYIANLGKYNEGELVGAWFTPPVYVFGVDYAVIMGILDMMKGSDRPCRKCESTC